MVTKRTSETRTSAPLVVHQLPGAVDPARAAFAVRRELERLQQKYSPAYLQRSIEPEAVLYRVLLETVGTPVDVAPAAVKAPGREVVPRTRVRPEEWLTAQQFVDKMGPGVQATIAFRKRTGAQEVRVMKCERHRMDGVKGVGMSYDPLVKGLLNVFDLEKNEHRHVNLERLLWAEIGGKTYVWTGRRFARVAKPPQVRKSKG